MRERPPCVGIRQLAPINCELPIHEQIEYAGCQKIGLFIGRPRADGLGIEYHHIGKIAGLEKAAVFQAQRFCRQRSAGPDGEGQRDDMFVKHIFAQLFGEGSIFPRVAQDSHRSTSSPNPDA